MCEYKVSKITSISNCNFDLYYRLLSPSELFLLLGHFVRENHTNMVTNSVAGNCILYDL